MAGANPELRKAQYQHYIPRFLLRRFSYPSSTVLNHGKKQNRKQRIEDVVTAVDLGHDIPKFVESPVGRIFGQYDMYKDDSKFSKKDQDRIETKLSRIEGQASRIIAKVADAHKTGKDKVKLSRHDKDLLRKYIFVMKYRSPIFFKRFNHQRAEDYASSDRALFLEYMQERNFLRPLDVWLDNLERIMEKHMDPAGKWTEDLYKEIYPEDAEWLKINIRSMYLSFATPSDAVEEFLLTENAFGIHEGPNDYFTNPFTGEQTTTAYTEFHVISVVSPRLVMILRDNCLPEPLEDQHKDIRNNKRWMLAARMQAHSQPDNAKSLLEDLPIAKARNSYTVIQDGRLELAEGADGVPRATDKFNFTFFRLESRHVQTINLVMLDQAHHSSHIVYKSKLALQAALDFYLDYPTRTRGAYSLKTISDRPNDPMLALLRKLETIAHSLGSSVRAKYYIDPLDEIKDTPPPDGAPTFNDVVAQVLETIENDCRTVSLVALPATVMSEVLSKLKMSASTIKRLDLMAMADNRRCFPDQIFLAVHKADTRGLSARYKRILQIGKPMWRSALDELVKQECEAESAKANRNTEFFENIRRNFDRISDTDSPDLSDALDKAPSFDETVSNVLATAETDFLDQSLASHDFVLAMVVMIQVVKEQETTVISTHALDLILMADGWPCFPDMVYSAVQEAHIRDCSERTRRLISVELMMWRRGWNALVEKALQVPGVKLDHSVDAMRKVLRQLPSMPSSDSSPTIASAASQNTNQHLREAPVQRSSLYSDTEDAPGRSRSGQLKRSSNSTVSSKRRDIFKAALLAFSGVVFICVCLAVLVWTLISIAWFLVAQIWNFVVLVWRLAL